MQALLNRGVSSRRGIMAIHREPPYSGGAWDARLPVTNLVTDTTVILPLFHEMIEDEQDYVVQCIEESVTRS
jgi:dTDP-4-amino-4,6-dideoxygalactose transaminase